MSVGKMRLQLGGVVQLGRGLRRFPGGVQRIAEAEAR
jgi:hypothetical protein